MKAAQRVVYNRLTTAETVQALALLLDKIPYRTDTYWPKNYRVEVKLADELCADTRLNVFFPGKNLFVGTVIVTGPGYAREVYLNSNPDSGLTDKEEFDHIKTALRRMIVAVAYRDFAVEKKAKEDRKKELLINGPEGSK